MVVSLAPGYDPEMDDGLRAALVVFEALGHPIPLAYASDENKPGHTYNE